MDKLNVVIIDDDSVCNMLSVRMLKKFVHADFSVFEVAEEALNFITSKKRLPDYIFLDIVMPVMDGWEFLEELKNELGVKEITSNVIILTSSIRKIDESKAVYLDCIESYVNKPLEKEDIEKIFKNHLVAQS